MVHGGSSAAKDLPTQGGTLESQTGGETGEVCTERQLGVQGGITRCRDCECARKRVRDDANSFATPSILLHLPSSFSVLEHYWSKLNFNRLSPYPSGFHPVNRV